MNLNSDVLDYISAKSKIQGIEVKDIINDLLRMDIDNIEGDEAT